MIALLSTLLFSERLRLDKLQGQIDTEFSREYKDISHPHNAYNLIKYWNNVLDLTKSATNADEMVNLLKTNGVTFPTANDMTGI